MTVGRMQIVHREPRKTRQDSSSLHVGLRCPATDFEQLCGAAQAALRISRVVSDVVRANGVAGLGAMARFESEISYPSISTAKRLQGALYD